MHPPGTQQRAFTRVPLDSVAATLQQELAPTGLHWLSVQHIMSRLLDICVDCCSLEQLVSA